MQRSSTKRAQQEEERNNRGRQETTGKRTTRENLKRQKEIDRLQNLGEREGGWIEEGLETSESVQGLVVSGDARRWLYRRSTRGRTW